MKIKNFVCGSALWAVALIGNSAFADEANTAAPVVDATTGALPQAADANKPQTDSTSTDPHVSSAAVVTATPSPVPAQQPALPAAAATGAAAMNADQRLAKLEQQVNNMANMNMPQQITQLQQQIAQLRGQLEVQGHDLQLLNKQLRNFYTDLNNRINQANNLNSTGPIPNNSNKVDDNASNQPVNIELKDANAYQGAFALLAKSKYDQAKEAFATYMNDYPNGKYVADAHYWVGEIHLMNRDYKDAETEFETVLNKYPQSDKVADSKLKLAIIHANTGRVNQAKVELQTIKNKNPNTAAAQLANIRLQQLNQGADLTEGQ